MFCNNIYIDEDFNAASLEDLKRQVLSPLKRLGFVTSRMRPYKPCATMRQSLIYGLRWSSKRSASRQTL